MNGHQILWTGVVSFMLMAGAVATTGVLGSIPAAAQSPGQEAIRNGYKKHAALAQLYRWYLYYERPDALLKNQIDILAENIRVKSPRGEVTNRAAYAKAVQTLPRTWRNAHFVHRHKVTVNADGTIAMTAEITYLNLGIKKDGGLTAARIGYATSLVGSKSVLPKFTNIVIKPVGAVTDKVYRSAYGENRVKSLMHYWLALIEDPARRLEPFKEILADGFVLNFSTGAIKDFATFEKWFRGPASSVAASTHFPSNVVVQRTGDNSYKLAADFGWEGFLKNGQEMTAKTRHIWLVVDDPAARFARIQRMDVTLLKPFARKVSK